MEIKIIDFGFAQILPIRGYYKERLGSKKYMAPEVLGKLNYTDKVDVWSATVSLYYLMTGNMPYKGTTLQE